jgi:hypothetical protein
VTVFFRPLPAWISPRSAPTAGGPRGAELFGIGGGGGAKDPGIGGGGGAEDPGIGGGGGGGAAGAPDSGIGGGGGGGGGGGALGLDAKAAGTDGRSCTGVGGLLSVADNGRGGAMVPKRIDARCLAEPPVGPLPSSSLESSFSESATDHSSSSGRRRDCGPLYVGVSGFAASWCAIRWKGLVEESSLGTEAGGESGWVGGRGGGGGAADGGPDSEEEDTESFLKYGFRDSSAAGLDKGVESRTLLVEDGSGANEAGGEETLGRIWLLVGVASVPCGVTACGPSSSDDESSPRLSSCNWSCLSRSRAASSSARWAASLASFSLASFSAAFFRAFSSCFLTLPALTCSSRALRRACAASRSFSNSSS